METRKIQRPGRLAEHTAETQFRPRAALGSPEVGLRLLDQLDHQDRHVQIEREPAPSQPSELRREDLEHRHRAGYERKSVARGELSDWEEEQVWPE